MTLESGGRIMVNNVQQSLKPFKNFARQDKNCSILKDVSYLSMAVNLVSAV